MKIKKNQKIKGHVREDAKGHYITTSVTPFEDGKKKLRLNSNLNGCLVEFRIIKTFKKWRMI